MLCRKSKQSAIVSGGYSIILLGYEEYTQHFYTIIGNTLIDKNQSNHVSYAIWKTIFIPFCMMEHNTLTSRVNKNMANKREYL